MGNKNIGEYYQKMADNITDPKETRNKAKDFSKFDIKLIKMLADTKKTLLDLGSGTGLLINNLEFDFKQITAVEKYPEFSKFILESPYIKVINEDLLTFEITDDSLFDIVSLFGVMNFFDNVETKMIYSKIYSYLADDGVLVVKNQMGIKNDVIVNGFSEELKTNYYSEYRHVDSEITLLGDIGFVDIEKIDIYPPEYNRWDNTHFYALVCHKQ